MFDDFKGLLLDWPIGTLMAVPMGIVVLMLALAVLAGICRACDSWLLPLQSAPGKVTGKNYKPALTETILMYDAALKTSLPQLVIHPEEWRVFVTFAGIEGDQEVNESFFNSLSKDDHVDVGYVVGRFSRGAYIRSLSKRASHHQ